MPWKPPRGPPPGQPPGGSCLERGRMAGRKARRELIVTRKAAVGSMPPENLQALERALAQLVARAFAAEYPHLFRPTTTGEDEESNGSGPSAAAAAVSGAPPASAGGPELWSVEHEPDKTDPHRS